MRYNFLFLFFFLSFSYQVSGQEVISVDKNAFRTPEMSIFFTPTSMIPFPLSSLQFAFEKRFSNPKNAIHADLGYLLPLNPDTYSGPHDMFGFRLRAAYRRYLVEPRRIGNFFISGQYFYQLESWNATGWFEFLDGEYRQQFDYTKNVSSNGLFVLFGAQRVGKYESRFTMDWQVGLGARARTVVNKGVPEDGDAIDNGDFLTIFRLDDTENEKTQILPAFHTTFKIGYIIK